MPDTPSRDHTKHTWPITERPAVWVTTPTGRHPGREHGYRNRARTRLVEWTDDADLLHLQEQPATRVEDRTHPDTDPD